MIVFDRPMMHLSHSPFSPWAGGVWRDGQIGQPTAVQEVEGHRRPYDHASDCAPSQGEDQLPNIGAPWQSPSPRGKCVRQDGV